MKKIKLLSVLALSFALAACGTAANEESTSNGGQTSETAAPAEEKKDAAADKSEGEAVEEAADNTEQENLITEEAAYVGQIDSNSIEVNTENETIALRVEQVQDVDWDTLEMNAPIVVVYYQNEHGQNILTDVELKK